MCTNHRGLALLSLPSSVPATLERRVCPLVKPPIQDDFQSWKLDQLFILSRIFESRGRLLNHSTRVLCTWRTHSIAFLEVSLGGCFRGMRCLVCKSWTFPVVVWLHQRCSVSHIHILWTEYLGWCGSVGFIGCNLQVALQLSVKRRELEWPPRGLRSVRGVATPSEGTVTQGRGVEVSQGPVYKWEESGNGDWQMVFGRGASRMLYWSFLLKRELSLKAKIWILPVSLCSYVPSPKLTSAG